MCDPYYFSTDAKILISQWKTMQEKIINSIKPIKQFNTEKEQFLLSDQQLYDTLNGPLQAFFKQKLTAYSCLAKARLYLVLTKDDLFKNKIEKNLNKELIKISNENLIEIEKNLNNLTNIHYNQWQKKQEIWVEKLILALKNKNISLSEIEIKELKYQETSSELINRFIDLNIHTIPSSTSKNFESYYRLKIYLTIHSSLSRQQQAHDNLTINKLSKNLNTEFKEIHDKETELIKTQWVETKDVIKLVINPSLD